MFSSAAVMSLCITILLCRYLPLFFVTLSRATLINSSNGAQGKKRRGGADHLLLSPLGFNVETDTHNCEILPHLPHRNLTAKFLCFF